MINICSEVVVNLIRRTVGNDVGSVVIIGENNVEFVEFLRSSFLNTTMYVVGATEDQSFVDFLENKRDKNLKFFKMSGTEAASQVPNDIDVVYIKSDEDPDIIKNVFKVWREKLSARGLILGSDFKKSKNTNKAIHEAIKEDDLCLTSDTGGDLWYEKYWKPKDSSSLDLKIAHVCNYAPGLSGMYGTVRDLMIEEMKQGVDARVIDDAAASRFYGQDGIVPVRTSFGEQADIICWHHAMVEDWFNEPHRNLILFLHGTPEFNFHSEINDKSDRALSLILGLSVMNIPRAFVTMWKRHVPIWQSMMKREVSYVPAWTNVNEFGVSTKKTDPDVIKIGMMDYWRLTREPFSFFPAIDMLRKISGKKVEVNVWGLCEDPSKTYEAVMQWLVKDEVVKIRGRTMRPMDDIFHQNDFILSMSTEETRVIRESFSCGVPVVCGRGGSLPFTDYSCDAVDSELMAQTMLRCHDDMCKNEEKMRVDLRKYAEKNFNVENAAREIIKIFNKTMKEHGSINHPKITGKIRPVASVNDTAEKLKERLSDPMKTTAYVRFGDGELLFMDNAIKTGGMHHNSPELRDELIKAFTFKQDGYLVSSAAGIINEGKMRRGLFANFGGEVDEAMLRVVKKFKMNKSTLDNYIALAYKSVFEPEWFVDFLKKCIHGKKVLFVGGEDLCRSPMIKRVFNVDSFVELPMVDAYYSLDEKKMREIQLAVQNNDVTLCAAGMCAKVIAYRIWSSKLKKNFVDIGSIADAVAGIKNTRTWIGIVGEDYRKNYENVFMSKRTDIVILTYKNEEKTIRCFEAIAKNTENYRVIWVDNGSGDESIEKVTPAAKKLEDCEIVKNKENLGFTKGVNQALRKIMMDRSSDYVALVNNDVVVTRGWKDDMIASVLLNELAAVGPVTSENNPHSISALRGVVSDLPVFQNETDDERALVLKSKFGTKILISDNMISFFCCMMRREMVEQVGLLDEGFFAYGEDNDYFERMKRLNMKFGIALGCYVHHDHGVTSDLFGKDWANKRKNEAKQRLYEKWEKNKPTKSSS